MERKWAGKAFIFYTDTLLLIKRPNDAVQSPGIWEVPGGRVNAGEGPIDALRREVREEAGLEIDVLYPFGIRNFTRVDNQIVDLIIYYCTTASKQVTLSTEHSEYGWFSFADAKKRISSFYAGEMERLQKMRGAKIFK